MILDITQIIISILLMLIILIQNRGTGLGTAFGGEGNIYRTKRGAEKILHLATIALAIIFMVTAFLNLIY